MKKAILISSSLILLFLIRTFIYQVVGNPLLFPSSKAVILALVDILTRKESLNIILNSFFRLLISIGASTLLALVLGFISGFRKGFATFISPYITILRTIPVLSIIVILLILVGFTYTPFIITFLIVFPVIYQGVFEGIKQMDSELIDVYRLEKKNFIIALRLVYFPLMKKYLLLAFLQSFGLGIKVLVMAEFLGQSRNSIGNAIYLAKVNLEYQFVFAWTILLIVLAFGIEYVVNKYQKKQLKEVG